MAKKKPTKTAKKTPKKAVKASAPKSASTAEAIHQLDAEFMKAANSARNAAALVKAFYAPGAVLMPPNHPAVEGPAIQTFLQGLIDSGLTSIKLETTTVASAGDLAYGRGHYALSLTPAGGAAPIQDVGKYVVVYCRQPNGTWRAVADIFNSDQAAGH